MFIGVPFLMFGVIAIGCGLVGLAAPGILIWGAIFSVVGLGLVCKSSTKKS
jgi:hypothetical protein